MRRWFTGDVVAHYRGSPSAKASVLTSAEGKHYSIEIYRALVTGVEVLGDTPSQAEPETSGSREMPTDAEMELTGVELRPPASGPQLFQPSIAVTHLVDAEGPGKTVLSTARDVRIAQVQLSHPASHGDHVYGRLEGTISGWFSPPPPSPEPEIVEAGEVPIPLGLRSAVIDEPPATESDGSEPRASLPAPGQDFEAAEAPLAPPSENAEPPTDSATSRQPAEPPFFLLGALIFAALLFGATPGAATIWAGAFLPSLGLRKWLIGVVPDAGGVRLLALLTAGGQLLLGALLIAGWTSAGCVSLSPLPLLFLLGGVFASSLMPHPLSYGLCAFVFATVVFAAHGAWLPPGCVD